MPVTVKYNDQQSELDLYIVRIEGPALWVRDWLRKLQLDWKSIKSLQVTSSASPCTQLELEKSAGQCYSCVLIRNRNSEAYQGEDNLG